MVQGAVVHRELQISVDQISETGIFTVKTRVNTPTHHEMCRRRTVISALGSVLCGTPSEFGIRHDEHVVPAPHCD